MFDIVICVGPNETDFIKETIPYTKKNIIGYRNIYLVCSNPSVSIEGTITIDEKIFPFTIDTLINMFGNNYRNGWYLQQLLKLYSGNIIPNILKRYLVIDADTYFLKPTKFITDDNKYIFTTGTEYHKPYFIHMNKLHTSFKKIYSESGISHHMIFDTDKINELMKLIEFNKKEFWIIFLECVDKNEFIHSGASEYELYFTFMLLYYNNDILIRNLKWSDVSKLEDYHLNNLDFISAHCYLRK
jgi:hypothetical protein